MVCEDLDCDDEERATRPVFSGVDAGSGMATPISSTPVVEAFCREEERLVLRVTVLESMVLVLSRLAVGDVIPLMEVRPVVVVLRVALIALKRRELVTEEVSLTFLGFSAGALGSDLFITSTRAFPMDDKFNDCRIEFRVMGFEDLKPGVVSVGIVKSLGTLCVMRVVTVEVKFELGLPYRVVSGHVPRLLIYYI